MMWQTPPSTLPFLLLFKQSFNWFDYHRKETDMGKCAQRKHSYVALNNKEHMRGSSTSALFLKVVIFLWLNRLGFCSFTCLSNQASATGNTGHSLYFQVKLPNPEVSVDTVPEMCIAKGFQYKSSSQMDLILNPLSIQYLLCFFSVPQTFLSPTSALRGTWHFCFCCGLTPASSPAQAAAHSLLTSRTGERIRRAKPRKTPGLRWKRCNRESKSCTHWGAEKIPQLGSYRVGLF